MIAGYFAIENSRTQTYIARLLTKELSNRLGSTISFGKVDIDFFNRLTIENILLEDQNRDTLFYTKTLKAKINRFSFGNKIIHLKDAIVEESFFNLEKDSLNRYNFDFLLTKDTTSTKFNWEIKCNDFDFLQSNLNYQYYQNDRYRQTISKNINLNIKDFTFKPDLLKLHLEKLAVENSDYTDIKNFSTHLTVLKDSVMFSQLNLITSHSSINNAHISFNLKDAETALESINKIDATLDKSNINLKELALIIPALKGMSENVEISGNVTGNTKSLKGKDITIRTGRNTYANAEFYLNDLTSSENMYLFFDVKKLRTTLSDISDIQLPYNAKSRTITFPDALDKKNLVSFNGNFSGFLSDFVVYGTFNSAQGTVKTDIAVVPVNQSTTKLKGKIGTTNFQLGELLGSKNLGNITFNTDVNGLYYKKSENVTGSIKGKVEQIVWNAYNYQNITVDGELDKKSFSGIATIDDPNLRFDFKGQANFNDSTPNFNFNLNLKEAMPGKLNLSADFPQSEINFVMNANFSGDNVDNLRGKIEMVSGQYSNKNGTLLLDSIQLESYPTLLDNKLSFSSKFFDADIVGTFKIKEVMPELKKIADEYIPSLNLTTNEKSASNNFDYQINAKDVNPITIVFAPNYAFETPFFISGSINADKNSLIIESSIPKITVNNVALHDIFISNKPKEDAYTTKINIGKLVYNDNLTANNINFSNRIVGNVAEQQMVWGSKNISKISSKTTFKNQFENTPPSITINTSKSNIYIKDTLWHISPFSVVIDTSLYDINDFRFYNKNQTLSINGKVSKDKNDALLAQFSNFQIKEINDYFNNKLSLSGKLNGSIKLLDTYNDKIIFLDLLLGNFYFNNEEIGNVKISNQWDNAEMLIKSEVTINNKAQKTLQADGWLNPKNKRYQYNANINELPLVLLESVIKGGINNFEGKVVGDVEIKGNPNNITMDGLAAVKNGALTVDFTQVKYSFGDTILLKNSSFLFKNLTIKDTYGNKGILNGNVHHTNFEDFRYQFSVSSPKILALHTTSTNNEVFNGTVFANAKFNLDGSDGLISIDASATTLNGTLINITPSGSDGVKSYDFIEFVTPKDSAESITLQPETKTGISVNLRANATNDAKVQLIYNSQIGDMIKAQGEGFLTFKMSPLGEMSLLGNYEIEKGDYLFTLQNVINKRFSIENGSSINWSGDIADATIDLKAIYKLRASVNDLLSDLTQESSQNMRIPVECKILLTEQLANPRINFDLNFPNAESGVVDQLQQYFNTEEEINRQILSLMVLGRFYTPEYMRNTNFSKDDYEIASYNNVIGQTTSELFSNQLNNWLSKLNNNLQFGFNYLPGNQITDDEIQVALSTQLFDNRVTINGNVGNSVNEYTGKNTQLIGDFEIFVKLTPRGKLQLKAYNRYNNNLFYETAPYTQGVGLLYKEEYNTWQELLYKIKKLFKQKSK